jgi:GTPase
MSTKTTTSLPLRDRPRLPVVVIVGRPNVGKSTLFNRLTNTRDALVSDLPGLTRDRREGDSTIFDKPVLIVDTAGLEDAAKGSIEARMRAQTEVAVAGADLIVFVIDARAGVTPVDTDFARVARNSGKPVILVANKCEGRRGDAGFYDAFEMGFGDPVAISAEHGEGLSDLEAAMAEGLSIAAPLRPTRGHGKRRDARVELEIAAEQEAARVAALEAPAPYGDVGEGEELPDGDNEPAEPDPKTRTIKVAIVGRPNAGKSTLVNALLGEDRMITGPEPGLTRDAVSSDLVWKGRKIQLFDTAGLRKRARIHATAEKLSASDTVRALRFAEVVVLLVDVSAPFEHQDLTIAELATDEGRALVLAVNKWDTVENKQAKLKELHDMLGDRLSQVQGVTMVPISALGDKGLDKLMAAVIAAHDIWNKRITTNQLNRWLIEAVGRHAPPAASGRRIKIRYMTQASIRPPTFVAFCSKPEDVPKSYVRYLTNGLREAFKMPGVPIRFNLRRSDNPFSTRGDAPRKER